MSQFLLPCSCGQVVRVASAQAGGQVQCDCGQRLQVPTLRGLRELEPASPEDAKTTAQWSRLHGVVFATAMLIALVGAFLVAYHGWQYLQVVLSPYAKDRSGEIIGAEAAHIDALTPEETYEHWLEVLKQGLGHRDPFVWTKIEAESKRLRWWMLLGCELIAGGAIVATTTLFVGRKGVGPAGK